MSVATARSKNLTIDLPPEFLERCKRDKVKPEVVLKGFIADLCGIMNYCSNPRADGYCSNGSDERDKANEYYSRCGHDVIW